MEISRQEESHSRDYTLLLSNDFKAPFKCTVGGASDVHVYPQLALDMKWSCRVYIPLYVGTTERPCRAPADAPPGT